MLELRPYQQKEVAWLLEHKRAGIFWDMGSGKTAAVTTVAACKLLKRWLIIAPDNAFSVWRDEAPRWIKRWWPEAKVTVEFLNGPPTERQLQWVIPYGADLPPEWVHIRVVTPQTFLEDWCEKIRMASGRNKKVIRLVPKPQYNIPQIVIWDECRGLRNKETQGFRLFQQWTKYYSPEYLYLMTGTPGHEPKHFWTLLNILYPAYFSSYWTFVRAFHMVDDTDFGMQVNEPKNLPEWYKVLGRTSSVVFEKDIEGERPPLTRQLLEVHMDEDQEKHYDTLSRELWSYVQEDKKAIVAQNEFVLVQRLRQVLVCPKILAPSLSVGQAIKDFAETVDPGTPTIIFTPFTQAFPHFREYLEKKKFHVEELQGGIGTPERDLRILRYRNTRGVIICSIKYAQAFSLEPATKCFFIGYEWDPDENRQAEKRLHRLTTLNPITAYYYSYATTFDVRLADRVNIKQQHVNITLPQNLREILGRD